MSTFWSPSFTSTLLPVLCGVLMSACGGGGGSDTSSPTLAQAELAARALPTPAVPVAAPAAPAVADPGAAGVVDVKILAPLAPPASGRAITDLRVESTGTGVQNKLPLSFGQVFADGDLGASDILVGKLADGTQVPLQVDVKASYADKSVRHAVISAVLPTLQPGASLLMTLVKTGTAATAPAALSPTQLLAAGFTAAVTITVDGQAYTASADALLATGKTSPWLRGALVNEWMVSAPLVSASGQVHPQLSARFDVRSYTGLNQAKIDVVIENDWAYAVAPHNLTYDAKIVVGGATVYTKSALTHYRQARWKKSFWWGGAPQLNIRHNAAYLIATQALPNYDQSAAPAAASLSQLRLAFAGAVTEPMQRGLATAYMPQTGGRPDLGLLPGWSVTYLLSMDKDAKAAMLGTADLAGSWSSHYRDQNTDRVVSLFDYPYMTVLGHPGDTVNPATRKSEAFPLCVGDCSSPLTADSAHEPNFAYLPYLVTGDHFYLEEMQFWAMFNVLQANPGYRDNVKGLLKWDQIRGQAWSLRSLGEAAAFTPDNDPLKPQFESFLANNLDWYNAAYSNNPAPDNALGAITDVNAMVYDGGTGLAPWQDDFFTTAVGHASELGYAKARALLLWKSKFAVGRMIAPGYCWIDASIYKMTVRSAASAANFTDFAHAYAASETPAVGALSCGSVQMAAAMGLKVGEMVGYADVIDGYPAYMQGALAYSVNAGNPDAARAWALFQSRPIKPDYTRGAQFAILPR